MIDDFTKNYSLYKYAHFSTVEVKMKKYENLNSGAYGEIFRDLHPVKNGGLFTFQNEHELLESLFRINDKTKNVYFNNRTFRSNIRRNVIKNR